jgi:Homeobox KN domain
MFNAAVHLKKACFYPHLLQGHYADLKRTIADNLSVLENFYLTLPISIVEEESIKHSVSAIVSLLAQLAYHLKLLSFESGRVESVTSDFQKKCAAVHQMTSRERQDLLDLKKSSNPIASPPQSTRSSISESSSTMKRNSPKNRPNHSIAIKVILLKWFGLNVHHPYPNEFVKKALCFQTGLTVLQLNTWFVNHRRRSGHKKAAKAENAGIKRKGVVVE